MGKLARSSNRLECNVLECPGVGREGSARILACACARLREARKNLRKHVCGLYTLLVAPRVVPDPLLFDQVRCRVRLAGRFAAEAQRETAAISPEPLIAERLPPGCRGCCLGQYPGGSSGQHGCRLKCCSATRQNPDVVRYLRRKPRSAILALQDGTRLTVYDSALGCDVTVVVKPGAILLFDGDVAHAGASYAACNTRGVHVV